MLRSHRILIVKKFRFEILRIRNYNCLCVFPWERIITFFIVCIYMQKLGTHPYMNEIFIIV